MEEKKTTALYRAIRWLVKAFYPKMEVVGAEHLPEGPAIIVGNHTQMNGPIAGELYFPGPHYIWCAGQMMELKEVPDYAFRDFWSFKPWYSRWFYRIASYAIAPLSVCIFNNAHTVPVYHDTRILTTFRATEKLLEAGARVIIYPEYNKRYNNILYDFHDKFVDAARIYYKKTGRQIPFVPMYIAPKLRQMVLGEPIYFDGESSIVRERARICAGLMDRITAMAAALPPHTVVPYRNIPKRDYPKNTPIEVYADDEAPGR